MTADYSQIEMRIMAHLSGDEGLIEAFTSGEDLHSFVASRAFDIPIEDVDPEMRRRIKAMSYGLAYGLSAYGLAQQLRITPEEARGQMHAYFERFGGIRDYLDTVVEEARLTGYTETTLGRRRYLPDLTSDNRQRREMAERMALNAPIQGSAADVIKVAMLNVEKAIAAEGLTVADAAAGARRARARGRAGGEGAAGGAGPPGDGRRRRALGAAGGLGRLRRQLGRRRPLRQARCPPGLRTLGAGALHARPRRASLRGSRAFADPANAWSCGPLGRAPRAWTSGRRLRCPVRDAAERPARVTSS